MPGNQIRPLPANKPGAVLLLTHRTSLRGRRSAALRWAFAPRRVLQNTGGNAAVAKTFDRDLGLLAWYLANPRPAGHAALDFETQSLGGRLGIGRNGKVDEIGHADVIDELRGDRVGSSAALPHGRPEAHISRHRHKESM